MKKVFLFSFLVFLFFSFPVYAACQPANVDPIPACLNKPPVRCAVVGSIDECCDRQEECKTCGNINQLSTAIGCIDTSNPQDFVKQILGLAVGIGGGIAFLLMLFGTFQIMASSGDPKAIQGGKETITSALGGLLLIIFSVFLLKLIGVDILGLPGLSKTP